MLLELLLLVQAIRNTVGRPLTHIHMPCTKSCVTHVITHHDGLPLLNLLVLHPNPGRASEAVVAACWAAANAGRAAAGSIRRRSVALTETVEHGCTFRLDLGAKPVQSEELMSARVGTYSHIQL
jgi:hypothetical protein